MTKLRSAYRSEVYSELCDECRTPTGSRCFSCDKPVCTEHAHLRCVTCLEVATAACRRCGHGVCADHAPKRSNQRCPECEKWLWNWAGQQSAAQAPARLLDFGAIVGLFAGSIVMGPVLPAAAIGMAAVGFVWPGAKIGYIAARRAAKVRQLRPDFLREKHPCQARCLNQTD